MAPVFLDVKRVIEAVLRRLDAEQLSKEFRSIAPFLIPFLKMCCVYFILTPEPATVMEAVVKCLPVLSLVWFVWLSGVTETMAHHYNRMILAALILCCVGDFLLVWAENELFFLLGMGAFALAHLVFSHAFGWSPVGLKEMIFTACIGFPIIALIVSHVEGTMFYPVLIYGLLLAVMEWRALARWNLKAEIPWRKILAASGATLFVVSDIILAVNKFCWPVKGEQVLIMGTYYAAQLSISLSVMNSCLVRSPEGKQERSAKGRE